MLFPRVSAACYRLNFPCFVGVYLCANVILQKQISLDQLQRQLDVKLFSAWYCTQPGVGIIKKPKSFAGFAPSNFTKALPQIPSCNYDRFAIALSLIKLNLPQNGHQLKCLDKSLYRCNEKILTFFYNFLVIDLCEKSGFRDSAEIYLLKANNGNTLKL